MRERNRPLFCLFATVLALWLALGFWPFSALNKLLLSVGILLTGGAALWYLRRYSLRRQASCAQVAAALLPPENFRGALVLVGGDTGALFPAGGDYRESRQGWYLRAANAEQLPLLAQHIALTRPALVSQLSILLAVVPEQQVCDDTLTQSLRVWHRSILACRNWLNGLPPVWSVVWLNTLDAGDNTLWFTLTPGRPGLQARQADHVTLPITEWQREPAFSPSRLSPVLWLDSVMAFIHRYICQPLASPQNELPALPLAAVGVCMTSVESVVDNLWHKQIASMTTLPPLTQKSSEPLPLPDVLLASLPCWRGISRRMRDLRIAGVITFLFIGLALCASFMNNQRLVRRIGDHLARYHHLSGMPHAPKAQAQQRLRNDSQLLDDWLRRGEPLRYGLGLYQGEKLIPPLDAAISDWSAPVSSPPVNKNIITEPQTIRLDALSLFDTGQWRLKPGSTKVLVNALVGIKARPGWLIVVAGHTDDVGDERANQQLSLKRAEAVRDWMRDTGDVPESCFAVQGYGESRPAVPNTTAEGRALNRRVEISLVPQADACRLPDIPLPPSQDESGTQP
ncbi:OmpA family protein [Cronobacter sakazakii]|uniref:OmpA family protein n=1 Tax=Cronobacter sakazakii TaxID=28141 RepID=UPI00039B6FDB|nr:OmpA family protein [Cronobacter sakazakii]EKK3986582.1 OmpA family protein [Cronobacter sakazakii]ELY2553946.1 OmpA family protein [Cronobacter sakazakii]ELY6005153.1 OmpA family protein [Cronobacter sakazakii]ELY6404988.1 OmpA family protein [Cronobacter sakazakii]MBF4815892.1 OmpA family protein [Cronobacter sakazakii]